MARCDAFARLALIAAMDFRRKHDNGDECAGKRSGSPMRSMHQASPKVRQVVNDKSL